MYIISLLITANIKPVTFLQLFVRCDDKFNSLDAGWNIPNDWKKNFNWIRTAIMMICSMSFHPYICESFAFKNFNGIFLKISSDDENAISKYYLLKELGRWKNHFKSGMRII